MVVTWQVRKSANQCNVYSTCFVIIEIAVFLGASLGLVVLCGLVVLRVTDSQNCCDIGVSVEMHSVATTFTRDVAPWRRLEPLGNWSCLVISESFCWHRVKNHGRQTHDGSMVLVY